MSKEQGHSPNDPKCRFYEPQQHVIAFNGEDNVSFIMQDKFLRGMSKIG